MIRGRLCVISGGLCAGLLLSVLVVMSLPGRTFAQGNPTPLPIHISSLTPTIPLVFSPTPSRTPTAIGSAIVHARDATIGANVRSSPDTSIDTNILGKIFPQSFFPVIGKWENWYEILYGKPNPDSIGWVYSEVVVLTGPAASIPVISTIVTADAAAAGAQSTADYLTRTPGAPASATALQLSATGVIASNPNGTDEPTAHGPLPTFTYPPPIVEATLAPPLNTAATQGGLPPIIPIIALTVVGVLGLLISGLRRN